VRSGGRKGRRTALMVRIAAERISGLFALAEKEASGDVPELADRYVRLARRIGMRYNVRLLPEYAETYCRGCSRFWVEGRTVRTRLRSGHRVRTCLSCGRERRVPYRLRVRPGSGVPRGSLRAVGQPEVGLLATPVAPSADTDESLEREGR
jgi:ribonuclease P protein subunit RPR2